MAFVKVKVLHSNGIFGKRLANLDKVLYVDILKYDHDEKEKDKDVETRFKAIHGKEMLFFCTEVDSDGNECGFWGDNTGEIFIKKLEELGLLTKPEEVKKDGI